MQSSVLVISLLPKYLAKLSLWISIAIQNVIPKAWPMHGIFKGH